MDTESIYAPLAALASVSGVMHFYTERALTLWIDAEHTIRLNAIAPQLAPPLVASSGEMPSTFTVAGVPSDDGGGKTKITAIVASGHLGFGTDSSIAPQAATVMAATDADDRREPSGVDAVVDRCEGYTAREWAAFARRKSAIASHICKENGQLKAKLNAKDAKIDCSSDSVYFDDPWRSVPKQAVVRNGGSASRRQDNSDWLKWTKIKKGQTVLASQEAAELGMMSDNSGVPDLNGQKPEDNVTDQKCEAKDLIPDICAKWGGLVKHYRNHRRGLEVFLERLTLMNGNVMESLRNMCAWYQTVDGNLPPATPPEVQTGAIAVRIEECMVSSFQKLQQGQETLQHGQTETVSGLGTLSSHLGNVANRCDDMEKNAKSDRARLEEVIEDLRQLTNMKNK